MPLTSPEPSTCLLCSWTQWRLPAAVRPEQYRLRLSPQLQDPYRVDGTVEVDFHMANAQRCIVLGALGMNITSAYLPSQQMSGKDRTLCHPAVLPPKRLRIPPPPPPPPGRPPRVAFPQLGLSHH